MPRPTVTIPKYIIGGVEDYAKKQGISKDHAHAALLLRGLREVGQDGFNEVSSEIDAHETGDGEIPDTDSDGA